MTDKEIEAGIERACECGCAPPSTGWTVNPFPIIRDYIERLKRRAEVAERNDKIKDRALNYACYDPASPRPVAIGDVYYNIFSVEKQIPSSESEYGYFVVRRFYAVKLIVAELYKSISGDGLGVTLATVEERLDSPDYKSIFITTTGETFRLIDEPFEEYIERGLAELKENLPPDEFSDEDLDPANIIPYNKLFTTEKNASAFAKDITELQKKSWEVFRHRFSPALPSWEDAWKEEEEKGE